MRRSLMLVIAVGLATLGSSIAWSEDSDQAALIKALGGAKLTLLQGIAQVAKGTEVPIEAKYEMAHGKLMLSITPRRRASTPLRKIIPSTST